MSYSLRYSSKAAKQLRKLDSQMRDRVREKLAGLREDPYPSEARKVRGGDGMLRVRTGDYRILYVVREKRGYVGVVNIDKRSRAYR